MKRAPSPVLRLFRALGVAALCLAAIACARSPGTASARSRIAFLHYFSGSLGGGIDALVSSFNTANPGLELVATPLDHESFKASILSEIAKSSPAELYSYWAGAKTAALVPDLEPLDPIWEDQAVKDAFPAALVDSACRYGSSIYLLPITQHYVGFFYNKALFAKAGIGEPADWPSFLDACRRLAAVGATPIALGAADRWPAQFWFDYLLLRTAGPDYRRRFLAGEGAWTDPEILRAFGLWKDLIDAGFFAADPNGSAWDVDAAMSVAEGRAGMILMGTWIIGSWKDLAPEFSEGTGYGFFPFPAVDAGVEACSLGPVDGLVVAKRAGNLAGALAALRFLAGAEAQEAMSKGSGALAPSLAVPASAYTPIQLEVRDAIAAAPRWAFNYDLAAPPERSDAGLSLFAEFLEFPDQSALLLERAQRRTAAALGAAAGQ